MKCPNCAKETAAKETGRRPIGNGVYHVDGECSECHHTLWKHTNEGKWRDRILDACKCGTV